MWAGQAADAIARGRIRADYDLVVAGVRVQGLARGLPLLRQRLLLGMARRRVSGGRRGWCGMAAGGATVDGDGIINRGRRWFGAGLL